MKMFFSESLIGFQWDFFGLRIKTLTLLNFFFNFFPNLSCAIIVSFFLFCEEIELFGSSSINCEFFYIVHFLGMVSCQTPYSKCYSECPRAIFMESRLI